MDLGTKTLSQLSEEGKEKMFVTLEVGSKISGYTKEYLDRLCHLQKVEYRMRGDDYVIELTSLLDATHTILLSYEDITFVDKNELSDPVAQASELPTSEALMTITRDAAHTDSDATRRFSAKVAEGITQEVPRFADSSQGDNGSAQAFSFVGRAVVSDGTTSVDNTGNEAHTPVSAQSKTPPPAILPTALPSFVAEKHVKDIATPPPTPLSVVTPPQAIHIPVHIPIGGEKTTFAALDTTMQSAIADVTEEPVVHTPVHLQVMREKDTPAPSTTDDWDSALLGATEAKPQEVQPVTAGLPSSPYRPITTALDGTLHHDPAPLFPLVGAPITIPERIKPVVLPGIPDLGEEKQVTVFAPQDFNHAHTPQTDVIPPVATAVAATPVAPPIMQETRPIVPIKPTVPSVRGTSQITKSASALPMLSEEHQLVLREQHPLSRSTSFNVAFAILFLGFSVAILGGLLRGGEFTRLADGSMTYVAGVGAVRGDTIPVVDTQFDQLVQPEGPQVLPFSDEITVTEGETPNSIIVQPVFKDSVGGYYEYTLESTSSEITRVSE